MGNYYNPYDRMPRIEGSMSTQVCVAGNLSAAISLARWRDAGEPGDFFEWLAQQEDTSE